MIAERLTRLRALLNGAGVDAVLLTSRENRRYLSGFTGSAGVLLVDRSEVYLLVDPRYTEQAREETEGLTVVEVRDGWAEAVAALAAEHGWMALGYEEEYLTCRQYRELQEKIGAKKLVPVAGLEELRVVKSEEEVARIAEAVRLVDRAFAYLCERVAPGRTELDIALDLEVFLRRNGADGVSFAPIVASGPRAAMPHGLASDRVIGYNELVIIDCGAVVDGYCSDFTRTLVTRAPLPWQEEIYGIVLEAQQAAIATVRAGVEARKVDAAARAVIEAHGYGDYFGHSTGHGVGLAVHEAPRLSKKEERRLEAGMVVTVEPGIYLPGRGGVRLEDLVVVREGGCEVLTGAPKARLLAVG